MKKTHKEKESHKRYKKWQQKWCELMATKYAFKRVDVKKVWVEAAVDMGYKEELAQYLAKKAYEFTGDDKDMIFFRLLDCSFKSLTPPYQV